MNKHDIENLIKIKVLKSGLFFSPRKWIEVALEDRKSV